MADQPQREQRPCGEALRGYHFDHPYTHGGVVYECPGGDVRAVDTVEIPCPLKTFEKPHDAHEQIYENIGLWRCPGWGEPDDGVKEPAPPQTDAQRIRDLEYVIQRAREALGADQPPCDHTARITALEDALREVLAKFVHPGHPGEPCKQTGWVRTATLDQWHAVLRGEA